MLAYVLNYILNISLLALGFGFVIFWHELGHFLAAKYVGIKVEQFAVGFGQAMLAWRKGVGVRIGTTRPEYERRVKEHLAAREKNGDGLNKTTDPSTAEFDAAGKELGLGETEYRLNWIPLGGYVKMLGQDDVSTGAIPDDPRAYPNKSVGARMLVISAGVIMNIILAAILFMGLFTFGHRVPPAIIGMVIPGAPASRVTQVVDGKPVTKSLRVGDEILFIDGKPQQDWTKVSLNTALADPTEPTPIKVRHVDGTIADYSILPQRTTAGRARDFLQLGIGGPRSLRGLPAGMKIDEKNKHLVPAESLLLEPGDAIVAVEGKPVNPGEGPTESKASDYHVLDEAVQRAGRDGGRPVKLTVRKASGETRQIEVKPHFAHFFGGPGSLHFAGLMPRTTVYEVQPDTVAATALRPGDVLLNLAVGGDAEPNPTFKRLQKVLTAAGGRGAEVAITVLRDGKEETVRVKPTEKTKDGQYILGFAAGYDEAHPIISGTLEDTAAAKAGIPDGSTIVSIGGKPVKTWHDIHNLIAAAPAGAPLDVVATKGDREVKTQITPSEAEQQLASVAQYDVPLVLSEQTFIRIADNPAQAAWWGVTETRDFILQFYVTLQRMFGGSISPKNLMGPVGIFSAGTQFAFKGPDWLIWFLAMISANLAVVNFLPIPVVDGGHFVFLCLEKIQGKPVSQRTQSIAQVVGLALLLGIFLLVTYQDIARMINPY